MGLHPAIGVDTAIAPQWQTVVAIAIATACGVWVLWRLVRPFIKRIVDQCAAEGTEDEPLIQITPAGSDTGAGDNVNAEQQCG